MSDVPELRSVYKRWFEKPPPSPLGVFPTVQVVLPLTPERKFGRQIGNLTATGTIDFIPPLGKAWDVIAWMVSPSMSAVVANRTLQFSSEVGIRVPLNATTLMYMVDATLAASAGPNYTSDYDTSDTVIRQANRLFVYRPLNPTEPHCWLHLAFGNGQAGDNVDALVLYEEVNAQ